MQTTINEIGQIVVEFPDSGYSGERLMIAAIEGAGFIPVAGRGGQILPTGNSVAEYICMYRAPATVRGTLQLNGRKVTPETYIRTWRKVVPVSAADVMQIHGITIHASFSLELEVERSNVWRDWPLRHALATFDDFETRFKHLIGKDGDCRLDLSEAEQAEAYAQLTRNRVWRSDASRYASPYKLEIESDIPMTAFPIQTSLFEEATQ